MNTIIKGCDHAWPALDYNSWKDTVKTIHQWTQIVGKIRLRAMPWQNHSWHATLYITARGFSTGPMPYKDGIFEIEFDFENHQLIISSTFNQNEVIGLFPRSVADFYRELFQKLKALKIDVAIHASPNELAEAIPFAENTTNKSYHKQSVQDFWQAAVSVHNVFQKFRSGFIGKCSPVHFFWGAFDLAVTRFSGRKAPLHQGGMPNMPLSVMQEAYSHEVSSAGFWPGSDDSPMPVFYSYCYPSPAAFANQKVQPAEAFWSPEMGEYFLKYDDVRQAKDPEAMLMSFLESTYIASANTGNWDRENLELKK
ncbi:DUF5996 family protein [Roseivirga echinicomitans]|uniref:Ava_C0101 and related proteins n=1 Tax=Roseivirga echinicomitans TaxID=296218 RepID=A0A150X2E8_9BACT|nr:DUF5996 family protein [Roseivirga echinicomitans]KYG72772.1 hypothetical protein AWN68_08695 [Roseivirga echinicomitans]